MRENYAFFAKPTKSSTNGVSTTTRGQCGYTAKHGEITNDLYITYDSVTLAARALDSWLGYGGKSSSTDIPGCVQSLETIGAPYYHGDNTVESRGYVDHVRNLLAGNLNSSSTSSSDSSDNFNYTGLSADSPALSYSSRNLNKVS